MMNEVIEGLFIGDYQDAKDRPKEMTSINVAYEHAFTLPDSIYLPILIPDKDGQHVWIRAEVLDAISDLIARELKLGRKVLVNCNMGQERAPLTVMWYLGKQKGMTLDDAYNLVKEKRPQTLDRRDWVKGHRG